LKLWVVPSFFFLIVPLKVALLPEVVGDAVQELMEVTDRESRFTL